MEDITTTATEKNGFVKHVFNFDKNFPFIKKDKEERIN